MTPGRGFEPLRREAPPANSLHKRLSPECCHLEAGTLPLCHPGTASFLLSSAHLDFTLKRITGRISYLLHS